MEIQKEYDTVLTGFPEHQRNGTGEIDSWEYYLFLTKYSFPIV